MPTTPTPAAVNSIGRRAPPPAQPYPDLVLATPDRPINRPTDPPLLNIKQLVRASLTCKDAWELYWELQGRVRALRAKNVESRRRRKGLFAQLHASKGLEVLSLTNVQHPCSSELGIWDVMDG